MRTLKAKDIFPKAYCVIDGELMKSDNGEYYNKQVAEYILKNKTTIDDEKMKELLKIDEEQLEANAIKYFKSQYSMLLLSSGDNSTDILYKPNKRFEIFILNAVERKIFLTESSNLPDGPNRDLYYSFEIANKIYKKLIDIKDSTFNDYEEIQYLYSREILQNESEISDLELNDNKIFEKDMKAYEIISKTPLYENYQLLNKDKKNLIRENEVLNKTILEYKGEVINLSKKIKISLEKIEILQKPKTFLEKLKDLFKNDKAKLLITDGKGE